MSDENEKTIILGAGVAGLSAAYHMKDKNYFVLEKKESAGGLASSVVKDGFTFDHTGHLLHLRDAYAKNLIFDLIGSNINEHKRSAWIFSHDVLTKYPFQANTFGLPDEVVRRCVREFLRAQETQKDFDPTMPFETWVNETFGLGFAREFFFPYNEKLWTVKASEMTCEWLGQFVPTPNMYEVLRGASTDDDTQFGYNATFYYPATGGIQSLVNAFVNKGLNIKFGHSMKHIILKEKELIYGYETKPGQPTVKTVKYNNIINTLPLPVLIRHIQDLPEKYKLMAKDLRWTSVLNINIGIDQPNVGKGKHWIYFPEEKFPFYRVGFPSEFSAAMHPEGHSSIYIEIAYKPEEMKRLTDANIQQLAEDCFKQLQIAEIIPFNAKISTVVPLKIPIAYVIYDRARTGIVEELLEVLRGHGIESIGRYGKWHYSFMEAAILEGKQAAEKPVANIYQTV